MEDNGGYSADGEFHIGNLMFLRSNDADEWNVYYWNPKTKHHDVVAHVDIRTQKIYMTPSQLALHDLKDILRAVEVLRRDLKPLSAERILEK